MREVQEAVRDYLQKQTKVHTVCAPAKHTGEYPLLAVEVQEAGTVVLAGGRQAERSFTVTVTAAQNRQRDDHGALLGSLLYPLLRGVPARIGGEDRVLHPLHLKTEGDKLCFTLCLCAAIPPEEGSGTDAEPMQTLHFNEEET